MLNTNVLFRYAQGHFPQATKVEENSLIPKTLSTSET